MSELNFDNQLQRAVSQLVVYEEGLKTRFSNFILDNLPTAFWEGDYSMVNELKLYSESLDELYRRGVFLRDIAEKVPDPQKQELLRLADEEEKRYEEFLQQQPKRKESTWIFNDERRKWVMNYVQVHLSRVLRNTYDSRSGLLHRGRSFPKAGLEEGFTDWLPDIFEEDYRESIEVHLFHRSQYSLDAKGGIFRICSCGDRKEVKAIFNVYVFERIVHDSILNYLRKLNNV
jgi:hypothetical protein